MQGEWTHSIFGCFDNITLCLITYFVPCYTFGELRKKKLVKAASAGFIYGLRSKQFSGP